jgi:hypothetical protein
VNAGTADRGEEVAQVETQHDGPGRVEATAPRHAAGAVDVTVTNANGTSTTSTADQSELGGVGRSRILQHLSLDQSGRGRHHADCDRGQHHLHRQ